MVKGITYFEVSGPDPEKLRQFYADTIGLKLGETTDGYTMVTTEDVDAIEGGIFDGSAELGVYAMPYVWVDDVDAAVDRVYNAGGKVLVPPFQHGPTRSAHVADPAGNRIGLFQPAG